MTDTRLVVVGAAGRMGRMLVATIADTAGVVLAGATERPGSPALGQDAGTLAGLGAAGVAVTDDAAAALAGADAVVDFSSPAASVALAALAAERGVAHVVGTTGLGEADLAALAEAARRIAVVRSGNMSLGVNLLAGLVRQAAAALGDDFDIEILEMHHRHKVDAPSGTALLLGEAAAAGRGVDLAQRSVRVRDGHTGARGAGDIGFAALRGGSVVGDHSVVLAGAGERLELAHRAEDRGIFARGAVRAALWTRGRPPGLYSMADVLGLA
ncbi:4-hydroxy-tetrahydrodipicolinate reductase [Chelatococcus reniformis]|uniref:4-hydroxy-tetrahydrodipicolinate reductase n=1 Tax=Chelatococcus reniformis TaxID=1494448 RepID=A0A916XQN5_9HYPH|nr:4-hydroxy-tetrahydrodipicolinate reductase [Chelatococcus reniformis]GGC92882.1 4-hydroxy-tetrahydrodipicolinate reductase [Chelatococcus reniformis]